MFVTYMKQLQSTVSNVVLLALLLLIVDLLINDRLDFHIDSLLCLLNCKSLLVAQASVSYEY